LTPTIAFSVELWSGSATLG